MSAPPDGAATIAPEALTLLRRIGGDGLVMRMVEAFLVQAPLRIERARSGFAADRAEDVRTSMHGLKSSSGQLGATRLAGLCAEIETRAGGGDLGSARSLLVELEMEWARVRDALRLEVREAGTT